MPLISAKSHPEHDKRRIFASLTRLLLREAQREPLLVIIEDIHWSDDTSLELLLQLMRRVADNPVLLLMTYRPDDVRPPLQQWLAQVNRGRLAREVTLCPLDRDAVAEVLREIFALPSPPQPEFVGAITALTQGNPFFIEEVLKSLIVTGEVSIVDGRWVRKPIERLRVPSSLQDTVLARRDRLSDSARALIELAAVAGRRFDFAVLQAASGLDGASLLLLMRELIAAQLVVEEGLDRFSFRHALTRETIYDSLLARERVESHRLIASAIELVTPPGAATRDADLAQHAFEAGAWAKAHETGLRAGEQARALHAPSAVVEHLSRAQRAADELGIMASTDLFLTRGWAYETLGEFDRARADYTEALRQAQSEGDRDNEWQALINIGFLWTSTDYAEARPFFDNALALARALGDRVKVAHSLNRVGNWQTNNEQARQGIALHREALAIFEALDDQQGISATLDLLSIASCLAGNLDDARAYGHRAAELFEALDDRYGLISSLATSLVFIGVYDSDTLVRHGNVLDAIATGERALGLAREVGWRGGEAFVLGLLGECYSTGGMYREALEHARAAMSIAEEIDHPQWIATSVGVLGGILFDLHALEDARACLTRSLHLVTELNSPYQIGTVTGVIASLCVALGLLDEAGELLGDIVTADLPMHSPSSRMIWCAAIELALARGEPQWALDIVNALFAASVRLDRDGQIPRLARLKAAALLALDDSHGAEPLLIEALDTAAALGARPEELRLRLSLHDLYRATGRQADAQREETTARSLLASMAETVTDDSLRENFSQAIAALLPPRPPQPSRRRADGLTRRESEIAALVAQGHMNRDIADLLSVGERTIETHISNILRKLEFTSRVQIAAWAVSHGLTSIDR